MKRERKCTISFSDAEWELLAKARSASHLIFSDFLRRAAISAACSVLGHVEHLPLEEHAVRHLFWPKWPGPDIDVWDPSAQALRRALNQKAIAAASVAPEAIKP